MPRANRYMLAGHIYHVTHRCHDWSFLFRFARDRDRYRAMLRDRLGRHAVSVLGPERKVPGRRCGNCNAV
ncbi:MAG: hypothetical protein IT577_18155 [Verrucomicrobiae bacterium]|nr:hypothetical protein [Verrucomicrobiae bacterium]